MAALTFQTMREKYDQAVVSGKAEIELSPHEWRQYTRLLPGAIWELVPITYNGLPVIRKD